MTELRAQDITDSRHTLKVHMTYKPVHLAVKSDILRYYREADCRATITRAEPASFNIRSRAAAYTYPIGPSHHAHTVRRKLNIIIYVCAENFPTFFCSNI